MSGWGTKILHVVWYSQKKKGGGWGGERKKMQKEKKKEEERKKNPVSTLFLTDKATGIPNRCRDLPQITRTFRDYDGSYC